MPCLLCGIHTYTVSGRVCPQYNLGCLCGFCSIAPWTCLSTKDCAAPGRVGLSARACVLHLDVSVYMSLYAEPVLCAAPRRICLHEPVLHILRVRHLDVSVYKSLCCTRTCLSTVRRCMEVCLFEDRERVKGKGKKRGKYNLEG